ncbi:NUDIX hydrolase, partial [Mycolicibacter hiberniae]
MIHTSTEHEVLAVVFQVRHFGASQVPELAVLLWQRALEPHRGSWALPGGRVRTDEDLPSSIRRQLAEKVDV